MILSEISSHVHLWLMFCSAPKALSSGAANSPGPLTPGLCPCAQHGLSFLVICCSSNPQLGEVPVEMVFFFQIQQLFFLFFTVCKLVVAKTHTALLRLFSIYFILTHKLKKKNSANKTKVFCYSSLFGLKHLPLCLFAHGKTW